MCGVSWHSPSLPLLSLSLPAGPRLGPTPALIRAFNLTDTSVLQFHFSSNFGTVDTMHLGFLLQLSLCSAVKHWMFKQCAQNPFCERNREFKAPQSYSVDPASVDFSDPKHITGEIHKQLSAEEAGAAITGHDGIVVLPFTLEVINDETVHLLVDEKGRKLELDDKKLASRLNPERYDPAEWVVDQDRASAGGVSASVEANGDQLTVKFGESSATFEYNTLQLIVAHKGETQVILNERGFFNLEHLRRRQPSDPKGWWEDTFDGYTDKHQRGPESIGIDSEFVGYPEVYGIPEHADSLSLRDTSKAEPYRLFNVDIFEYETGSPMSMYGAIPFMQAHKPGHAAGVFWLNSADTYIDITKDGSKGSNAHWISETGKIDVYVFVGDKPSDVLGRYGELTGTSELPQLFATAYHQCRWNYMSQEETLDVHRKMDEHDFPYDVMWLDIEWSEARRYFEWNKDTFPDPQGLFDALDESKRKLVLINDPHIKSDDDYEAYTALLESEDDLFVKDIDGVKDYHAHCWPGESTWIESLNRKLRPVWNKLHALGTEIGGTAKNLFLWSDMDEPSVFSGSETTMQKSVVHHGGFQHRDIHNIYGTSVLQSTYEVLRARYDNTQRPFVLTRSFFAGSQAYGAIWTGDNQAEWEYLKAATPMILTLGVSGFPFVGADVGGFFRNPTDELQARWYQAGSFYPFFRGHAHIESRYREPYLLPDEYQDVTREAIDLRYSLLPHYYTLFWDANQKLQPILQPMYYVYPEIESEEIKTEEDQFFLGDEIVVKPVIESEATSVEVLLPAQDKFYDYFTGEEIDNSKGKITQPVDLHSIPMYLRGGSVVPRRDRKRRSAELTLNDPYTLVIALDKNGEASGHLYADDAVSFEYKTKNDFLVSDITVKDGVISGRVRHASVSPFADIKVEKIIVYGGEKPAKATTGGVELDILSEGAGYLVRNPQVKVGQDWDISLN